MKEKGVAFGLAIAALVAFCGTVRGDLSGVNILSEDHHVWGRLTTDETGLLDSYDETANHALSGSLYDSGYFYANSSTGLLSVGAASNAHAVDYEELIAWSIAEATWVFRPEWSLLSLEIDVFDDKLFLEDSFSVNIEDVTAGTQLYYYSDSVMHFPDWETYNGVPFIETFSVDPMHVYSLYLGVCPSNNWTVFKGMV